MKIVNSDTLASEILKKECILTDTMRRIGYAVFTSDIMKTISDAETVDAVEVVRCKDCKHYGFTDNRIPEEQVWWCYFWDDVRSPMRIVLTANGRTVTMGRLIDIDRLCNDLMERWSIADKKKENLIRVVMADVVTPIVVSQPTVDAVPVVRCKDCRHCQYDSIFGSYWCGGKLGGIEIEADFFCKDGEQHDS